MADSEPTDEELLKELAQETQPIQDSPDTHVPDECVPGSAKTCGDDTFNAQPTIGGEAPLTQFQESVISTGSEVSIVLMVVLLILFVLQFARKAFHYFALRSKINRVRNPLEQAKPIAAEDCHFLNKDFTLNSVVIYNTEFKERTMYEEKQKENAPREELKGLLLKRAMRCVERFGCIRRDARGIRKNWNSDLLPNEVFEDFKAAQKNIEQEIGKIIKENKRCGYKWGEHKEDVFALARAKVAQKNQILKKIVAQKRKTMEQKQKKMKEQTQKTILS
eukprot:17584_1